MIHPSYVDLMQVVNKGVEEGETPVINSRYSIVMATAKRARQIVDGDEPMIHAAAGEKPLSIAVEELNQEKIHILAENAPDEEEEDVMLDELSEEEGGEEMIADVNEEESLADEAAVMTDEAGDAYESEAVSEGDVSAE